jgi:hypothetical protein
MTTEPDKRDTPTKLERGNTLLWALLVLTSAVLAFIAFLPWIGSLLVVALWGLGGSGSNK